MNEHDVLDITETDIDLTDEVIEIEGDELGEFAALAMCMQPD